MKDFDILKVLGTGGNFYIHKGTLSLSSISLQLDGVNLRIFNLRLFVLKHRRFTASSLLRYKDIKI